MFEKIIAAARYELDSQGIDFEYDITELPFIIADELRYVICLYIDDNTADYYYNSLMNAERV